MNDLKTVRDEILEADLNCKQVIIDILDRMIETPAPQGWSAIETAPKDGTEILLALWSGHPEHKTSFCWAINGHHKDGFFYSKDPMVGKLASPTHWQHITAPTPAPTDPSKFKYDRSDYVVLPPIRKNEDGSLTDSPTEKVDYKELRGILKPYMEDTPTQED